MKATQLVELRLGYIPEAAISGAVLIRTEYSTYLTFNATKWTSNDEFITGAGTALVEFARCRITKFGYPNDEARFGIPEMSGIGYGIYEVMNSPWIEELTRLNRFSFPDTSRDTTSRHFVFAFHDSTFECIADDIKMEVLTEPYENILSRIAKKVIAE